VGTPPPPYAPHQRLFTLFSRLTRAVWPSHASAVMLSRESATHFFLRPWQHLSLQRPVLRPIAHCITTASFLFFCPEGRFPSVKILFFSFCVLCSRPRSRPIKLARKNFEGPLRFSCVCSPLPFPPSTPVLVYPCVPYFSVIPLRISWPSLSLN